MPPHSGCINFELPADDAALRVRTIPRKRDWSALKRMRLVYPVDRRRGPFVVSNHNYFSGEA